MFMGKSISLWLNTSMSLIVATALFGCTEMPVRNGGGNSGSMSGSSASVQAAPVVDVAAGTQGDSLAACLGRIPSNATAGQRQLAEMSCQRDERSRQPIVSVPGK
jgi:hypothetical protein